jgi:hypothetical protein
MTVIASGLSFRDDCDNPIKNEVCLSAICLASARCVLATAAFIIVSSFLGLLMVCLQNEEIYN